MEVSAKTGLNVKKLFSTIGELHRHLFDVRTFPVK